jgi:peptidoglycan/LPS O-acetylase OafA/YrhL
MYFYVVFAIVLLMPRRLALPVMTAFLLGSAGLGLLQRPEVPMLALMTSALLVEFLCGIWIARAFVQDVTLPAGLRGAMGLAALAVLAVSPLLYTNGDLATWWRLPFFGLPAAALMAAVLLRPGLSGHQRVRGPLNRLMVALGASSYALYLTHVFTLRIAALVLHRMLPAGVEFALIFVAAVIVGHLFFVLVERPVYRVLKARFLTRKTTEVPA